MNRLPHILIAVPLGLALGGLTACSSNVSGKGSGTASAADSSSTSVSVGPSSSSPSQTPTTTPTTVLTQTTTTAGGGSTATKPPAPQFVVLKLSFDRVCAPQGGITSVEASITWQVMNATGIEVNIDNTNEAGSTAFNAPSGTHELTSIQCGSGDKYTFDVWTLGGAAGQQAHRQLTYVSTA